MLNQSLLHFRLLLSAKSLIFYMGFLAIKPLALIKFLAKLAAAVISDSLTLIFNQAITLSSFPDEWKIARVVPQKNGQRSIPGNYRPYQPLVKLWNKYYIINYITI